LLAYIIFSREEVTNMCKDCGCGEEEEKKKDEEGEKSEE
jgi:hypothetical protein